MPSQSRKRRGAESERVVAAHLASSIWPYAEPAGAGRGGRDITGTPGAQIEIKARRGLNLAADLRQAAGHGEDLPILIVRLDGQGPVSIAEWPAVLRLGDLIRLLRMAGFGEPIPTPDALDINPYVMED